MDSFFFNITDTRYKISTLYEERNSYLRRIDISNGLVFLEGTFPDTSMTYTLNNLDRMVMIVMVMQGEVTIEDHLSKERYCIKTGESSLYLSSKQAMTFTMHKSKVSDVFILFIADFFLKRYLSGNRNEPIDYLYQKIQKDISLEKVDTLWIDALSLYNVEKLLHISTDIKMQSIRAEHRVIELMMYRFSLLDIFLDEVTAEELTLAARAKSVLLRDFIHPPTIRQLAHLCATNESKLKKVFKKVYQTTLYNYIQKLRLAEANLLLKEENMTIGEIAKRVGYKHQGHFSKLFFSSYGVYPKELIKG
jgi:AraC-like DNA-binding protein